MNRLVLAAVLAAWAPSGAASGNDRVAPAVTRKPPAAASVPATPPSSSPAAAQRRPQGSAEGKGYRTSWDSYKGGFRSGYADAEWDDANVGFFSWAGGSQTSS